MVYGNKIQLGYPTNKVVGIKLNYYYYYKAKSCNLCLSLSPRVCVLSISTPHMYDSGKK